MPLRPFPWPVNVGIDIVSVNRVRGILSKGDDNFRRYLRRFLTPIERSEILHRYGDADLMDPRTMTNISHIWAAKEATIKAVTWRRLTFYDIIIRRAQPPNGYVHAVILDRTATDENHAESVRPPNELYLDRGRPRDNTFLHKTPPSTESLHHGSEGLSKVNATKLKVQQEDSSTLPPRPDIADEMSVPPIYEDVVLQNLSGQVAQISISHDGAYATAVCLAAQEPMEGDVGGELAARRI